jgi:phi LC3 family holin
MKINWKVRFKQPVFITTFTTLVLTFVYNLLAMFEIVPSISQDMVMNVVIAVVQLLAGIGVLVDPTTKGVKDSERAMGYTEPN